MIVHHDLGRAPCVRPVIVWAEALFAEQRDIIAGVLLGPQRGQLGPLPSLAPDVAFAPIPVLRGAGGNPRPAPAWDATPEFRSRRLGCRIKASCFWRTLAL